MPSVKTPPREVRDPASESPGRHPFSLRLWAILGTFMMLCLGLYFMYDPEPIRDIDPERKEKLLRELHKIDNAEQYVLLAMETDFYPCLNCGNRGVIFLRSNEVWRYGVTRNGRNIRYPGLELSEARLRYVVQFRGTLAECLKQEKIKIYNYAVHPENLRRSFRLIRPPGNPRDH